MWLVSEFKKGRDPRRLAMEPKKPKKFRQCVPFPSHGTPYTTLYSVTDWSRVLRSVLSGGDLPSRTASDSRTPGSRWTSRTPDTRTVYQDSPSEGPRGRIERSSAMSMHLSFQHYPSRLLDPVVEGALSKQNSRQSLA